MDGHRACRALGAAVAAVIVLAAAGQAGAQPRCGHRPPGRVAAEATLSALDIGARNAIEEALADERRTEAAYQAVIAKMGDVRPFSNAVHAEARHAALLEERLTARGLAAPSRPPSTGTPAPDTRKDACTSAVASERANVALYDRLLSAGSLPDDVRSAFEHNRWASLEHHLPAFQRCAGDGGGGSGVSARGPGELPSTPEGGS